MMPLYELMISHGLIKLFQIWQISPNIFTQFFSEIDQLTSSPSISSIQAIEQDVLEFNPTSSLESPIPSVVQHSSILSPQDITSPTLTTIQISSNVHITERTIYQTESIVTPTIDHNA
ncbi:unnamed protein product [Rotaria sordida]|uniref:Uncharacterized protein n=1 Tax=Rotaria sordida TaxID=392033 RepID=A0A815GJ64_9BILA|nr:unnamed protein product [Rotaria sordida]CAF1339236.1 unnamed protein product [Rotaria sordida]CAF1366397.1 unnamed protein product [Rotaria sordida]CAF1424214.1 unnamed protein product [Rotaria sordida]CAF1595172.1 unnamed protein product [Rotaria sordida]